MIIRPVANSKPGEGLPYKNDGDAGRTLWEEPLGDTKILWDWLEWFIFNRDTNSKIPRYVQSYLFLNTLKRIAKVPVEDWIPQGIRLFIWKSSGDFTQSATPTTS